MLNLLRAITLGVMLFAVYVGYAAAQRTTTLTSLSDTVRIWDAQARRGNPPDAASCEHMRTMLESAQEELAADRARHQDALSHPPAAGSRMPSVQRAWVRHMRKKARDLDERAETIAALELRIGALCRGARRTPSVASGSAPDRDPAGRRAPRSVRTAPHHVRRLVLPYRIVGPAARPSPERRHRPSQAPTSQRGARRPRPADGPLTIPSGTSYRSWSPPIPAPRAIRFRWTPYR